MTEGVNDSAAVEVAILGGGELKRNVSFNISTCDGSALDGEYTAFHNL